MTFEEAIAMDVEQFFRDHPMFAMKESQLEMLEMLKDRISKHHTIDCYSVEEIPASGGCYLVTFELIEGEAKAYVISADGKSAKKAAITEKETAK